MPVKITRHYAELARRSPALQRLIKASPDETLDLAGSQDPGHQLDYSPVEGVLHEYEIGLVYAVATCSAHCRFCYREELIARKVIERADGRLAPKDLASLPEVVAYVRAHDRLVAENGGVHPDTGRGKLREILLSGGEPMVLSNAKIAAWLAGLAEAGVEAIRVGSKEMAFHPDRFDRAFLAIAVSTSSLTGPSTCPSSAPDTSSTSPRRGSRAWRRTPGCRSPTTRARPR